MHEEDQDSLFGSPPPSPRFSTASICDNERRLSTSTDTQNVGTIALPGSHYSELPLNPLALSLNHTTVQWPPAQSQDQQTTAGQNFQPWQSPPAQNDGSEHSRSSLSPFPNVQSQDQQTTASQNFQPWQSPPSQSNGSEHSRSSHSPVPSRDPEFSLPDPSEPPPTHFLRNQQNLLGKAGLVAGVKPSTINIRGTSFNPIVVDDEDTPILGRQSRDSRNLYTDPSLLAAPTNEDIVSVLIGQKDIFPVLDGILSIIGRKGTRPTSTTYYYDVSKPPPIKKRKLHRVPAGATDWDVPYPFQKGDGPDEYHKTWERKRAKDLVVQLVKLIKLAARKAAIKNHLLKEKSRQSIWEELIKPEPRNQPSPLSQISFDSIISSLVSAQSSLTSSRTSTPGLGDFTFTNVTDSNFDSTGESSSAPNTAAVPDDLDALISSMLNSFPLQDQGIGTIPVPSSSSSSSQPSLIGDDAIDPALLALSAVQSGSSENLSMSEVLRTDPVGFSSADRTIAAEESPPCNTLVETDIVLPSSYEQQPEQEQPTPTPAPVPGPGPPAPRPKTTTISQSRKEDILRRAREKRKQVQEELDRVKTQLWETTIEQAALVHLLKRYDSEE